MIKRSLRQAKKTSPSRAALSRLRRQQILEAAKRCFARIGFHSTSMAQIAGEARMSVGQIYRHFQSKESLIEGIVEEDVALQLQALQSSLKTAATDLVAAVKGRVNAKPPLVNRDYIALMLEVGAEAARNPKIRTMVSASQRRGHALLKKRIESIRPGAWPHGELDIRLRLIYAVVQGVFTQMAIDPRQPSEKLLARLWDLTRQLLTPDAARARSRTRDPPVPLYSRLQPLKIQ